MRGKLITGLAIVLVMGLCSAASAGVVKGELLIAPRGSLSLPVGDYPITGRTYSFLKDDVKTGFAFGAMVDMMVSGRLSVGAQFDYNISTLGTGDLHLPPAQGANSVEADFTWKTLEVTGHARYYFLPLQSVTLFAHIGAGAYLNKFSPSYIIYGSYDIPVESRRSQSKTSLGLNAGPGVMLRLSPTVRFSLEALLHNVFTPNQNMRYLNVTAGLVFGLLPE
jgi:opacity protein-like surface antigen